MADIAGKEATLDRAIARARRRILPFLVLMYVLAFIDRSNVGFAKLALQRDVAIGDAAFAFGAGVFFCGYAMCEVPSNLLLAKFGARTWLARIMVTWGIIAAAMALTRGPASFYVLRFLLGIAEAGFFPGIIFYLTLWFPSAVRARTMGIFYFGLPLSLVLGGPLSGLLLELPAPWALRPWQFMFGIEGAMASLVGVAAWFYLTDRPADAADWMPADERAALGDAVAAEDGAKHDHGPRSFAAALGDRRVLAFCLIYFTVQMSVYGVTFYLPTRIAELTQGTVGVETGLLSAIPWLVAIAATYAVTRIADATGRRRPLAVAMLVMAALGILASALASSSSAALIAFCFAAAGFVAIQPLFWTLPTGYLGAAAAAGAIGLINAVGNLGGFVAPNLKTWAEHATGLPQAGMIALAAVALLGALLLLVARSDAPPLTPERSS